MLLDRRAPEGSRATKSLTLTFDHRRKSRLRTRLDDGGEAAVMLERGTVLRDGDMLVGEEGVVVVVRARDQLVSTVAARRPLMLARAAYHLGNRHVALQIAEGWIRYEHDHVLDDLVRGLGLEPVVGHAPFEPEIGSYAGADRRAHSHAHDHGHRHEHDVGERSDG